MQPPPNQKEYNIPPLRTAVVGLGRIGFGFHCPEIHQHPSYRLVGLVDALPERRSEASLKWNAPAFESVEAMLPKVNPDLVVIASPTPLHAEHARLAFSQGAHVLCDKPAATSVEEFDRMVGYADAGGKRLITYQPCRFQPEVRTLKALLREGRLGPVHLIRRSRCNYERRQDWQAFQANGGGLLNNYGSHCIDELMWLLDGVTVRSVYCQTRRIVSSGNADDVVKALFVTTTDLLVDLEISQASALEGPAWEVFGAHGAARWHATTGTWHIRCYDPGDIPPPQPQTGLAAAGRLYRTEQLPWKDFTPTNTHQEPFDYYGSVWHHIVENAAPPVTTDETRRLLGLIERCRESAKTGSLT